MILEVPSDVNRIIERLNARGCEAFAVGGCVRDSLLGRIPNDWDITTSARPEEIKRTFRRTVDTGIEHGTVTVLMNSGSYEVTTYRIDGDYGDGRHPDSVQYTDDLTEDLKRRDFTINAMAYAPDRGVIDVFGGREDLRAGIIRCVGDPDERFDEDALRILRAVRFAAQLGFTVEEKTSESIERHTANLAFVSKERVFTEINKILCSGHPEMLRRVYDLGMAEGIAEGMACVNRSAADRLTEAAALRPEKYIRWAAFLRDCSEELIRRILKELKSDNQTLNGAVMLAELLKKPLSAEPFEIRKTLLKTGPDMYDDYISLCRAGFGTEGGDSPEEALAGKCRIIDSGDCYNLKMLHIDGKDLIKLGVRPGPGMGDILEKLLYEVMKDPSLNEYGKLADTVSRMILDKA